MHFDYKQFERKGLEIISLYYIDEIDNDKKEIWISPKHGMNLCRYRTNGKSIIDFDPDAVRDTFSGNPLLYPTPNRVHNGILKYNGKEYPQVKNSKIVFIHGLVYNEPFKGIHIDKTNDSISISGYVDFDDKNHLYMAFPFKHTLNIRYTLDKGGVRFDYEITSYEEEEKIPFGIALHPYFMKIDGEEGTLIKAPFDYIYKNIEEDLIPTGDLEVVAGTDNDLSEFVAVGKLSLDTVFTGNKENVPAVIDYVRSGIKVTLECSDEFTHMVIYTPKGEPFFCMENQTCATDAHNLYAKGLEDVSGLMFVEPKATFSGHIYMKTESYEV